MHLNNLFAKFKLTHQVFNSLLLPRSFNYSTKKNLRHIPQNSQKMSENIVRVRIDQTQARAAISLKLRIHDQQFKELNFSRSLDEEIATTFQKLYSNYTKHVSASLQKANKKLKKNDASASPTLQEEPSVEDLSLNGDPLPVNIYDLDNNKLPLTTLNSDAWQDDFVFKLRDQIFRVSLNVPTLKSVKLPKLLIAGMPALVKLDLDSPHTAEVIDENSTFTWYCTERTFTPEEIEASRAAAVSKKKAVTYSDLWGAVRWWMLEEGVARKWRVMEPSCTDRFIRVECVPSDGKRTGVAVEGVSAGVCKAPMELESMPMTRGHELTKERLSGDR
jgi:hypothetical protein